MTDLWIVEYNWKTSRFHTEPLRHRIKRNISQILHEGKPANPDWVLVGICTEGEQLKYVEAFMKLLKSGVK